MSECEKQPPGSMSSPAPITTTPPSVIDNLWTCYFDNFYFPDKSCGMWKNSTDGPSEWIPFEYTNTTEHDRGK